MADGGRLDVMSYNVHHGEGMDGEYDLRRVAGDIWAGSPDVVGLQELDRNFLADAAGRRSRSDFDDQIELLAGWLEMDYEFGANLVFEGVPASGNDPREYGIGVLSAHEIRRSDYMELPDANQGEKRGLLGVELHVGGTDLWFYTTHLGLEAADRRRQIEAVVDRVSSREGPVVVAGDFNAGPDGVSPMLEDHVDVLSAVGAADNTFPAPYTGHSLPDGRRIDYLFCSEAVTPLEGRVIETVSSDHVPIRATVEV